MTAFTSWTVSFAHSSTVWVSSANRETKLQSVLQKWCKKKIVADSGPWTVCIGVPVRTNNCMVETTLSNASSAVLTSRGTADRQPPELVSTGESTSSAYFFSAIQYKLWDSQQRSEAHAADRLDRLYALTVADCATLENFCSAFCCCG